MKKSSEDSELRCLNDEIASLNEKIDRCWKLADHWESEGKRCYELAHKRTRPEQTVMAQSVRFFMCAKELKEVLSNK